MANIAVALDDKWEEDKEDIKEDVEDFPEDAARWTGEKVSLIPALLLPVLLLFTDIDGCDRSRKSKRSPIASSANGTTPSMMSRKSLRMWPDGLARKSDLWSASVIIWRMRMMRASMRAARTVGRLDDLLAY